ncbi:MAG: hypothetical protein KIT57_08810 [Blastocatellales bacterium]|nr:hypothetical protein [Blastocatellales bacterium]
MPGRERIERVVGVDIGIKSTVATSDGQEIGQFSEQLKRKLGTEHEEFRRKQKLNACLRAKGLPEVGYGNRKVEAFSGNEINGALNRLIDELAAEPGVGGGQRAIVGGGDEIQVAGDEPVAARGAVGLSSSGWSSNSTKRVSVTAACSRHTLRNDVRRAASR